MGLGMWEQQGWEAGNSLVVLLLEVRVREARGEGGGSEKETRMRWATEGRREVQELLALEGSRGGVLEGKNGNIKVKVNLIEPRIIISKTVKKNFMKLFFPNTWYIFFRQ